jgi:hypothetical protein
MGDDINLLDDIWFDVDDQFLFFVDDLDLRGNAIRHSVLPRLQLIMNNAIVAIRAVYGVDVLEDSHVQVSPNFRRKRVADVTVDYQWATIGLSGKRAENKWHGFARKDKKQVRVLPFKYELGLTHAGLGIRLHNYWLKGLTDESYQTLLDFHLEYADVIHTLCFRSGILPLLNWGQGCEPFSSFTEHYQWMRDNRRFDNDFYSTSRKAPLRTAEILDLIEGYVVFFPVYDAYIQIAKFAESRFGELVARLNGWYLTHVGTESAYKIIQAPTSTALLDANFLARTREIAAERVRLMPELRYQVFHRDGFRCVACGRRGGDDGVVLHVDHIVPRSKGGEDTLDNLQTLCSACNLGKSNRDDTDLRRTTQ